MKKIIPYLFLLFFFFVSSCGTTEKVLRNADANFKYVQALEWYNKGAYFKAIPVFEELMGLYKGSKTTEEIYYYYCMAQYNQGSYILSAYHFKNYVQQHPFSKYTEECLFMHAKSYDRQSPKYNLDQTETYKAIEAYQVFINQYPESDRVALCNDKIDELRLKLETKAIKAAELYYKTENFRAAAFAYKNLLIDYPDIDDAEEIQFKIVKSFYKYAEQSIVSKQQERYEDVIKVANTFESRYANSAFMDQVKATKEDAHLNSIKAAHHAAMLYALDKRDKKLKDVFEIYNMHSALLETEKNKALAEALQEQTYFELIRTHFLQAQNLAAEESKEHYIETIQAYSDFINLYETSKYSKEALKIYNASQKNLKKISNG
ncbi:MAG: outer membrane protein assembly factor BamD [Chitinophagales bacterium]|nr:outer membrane protein assembly factor BamD [Bacteroidota bacterium]MCB9256314.1 outer membrane protein assembly factor BamD [Chitinophagales bacterium]